MAIRGISLILGLGGVAWGIATLPSTWRSAPLERAGGLISQQHPFKSDALELILNQTKSAQVGSLCRPTALRSAATIQLRLLEDALDTGQRTKLDQLFQTVDVAVKEALVCGPADPFLWFALYWLELSTRGVSEKALTYLALSYELGPNEGWIALKRNRAAFSVFEKLPPKMADQVISEFIGLIATNRLYSETAQILIGPAWRVRHRIIPRLSELGQLQRMGFVKTLYHQGYEIDVPGIRPFDYRRRQ